MSDETKQGLLDVLINAASFGLASAKNAAKEEELIEEKEDEKEVENCGKKAKNEDVDKRKLIDEVAGMMKSAGCDDELIRTAIGKMEKIGYDKSEAKTADNEEEDKKEKKEDKKEAKNIEEEKPEEKEEKEVKYEDFKKEVAKETEKEVENCKAKAKNSLDDLKAAFYEGKIEKDKKYMTQAQGIELGKELY